MAFTFYSKDQTDTLLADYLTLASASATYLTSAAASATYLPKSGGTLSGQVYLAQTPDDQYSLVNRKYVDDAIQSAVFGTITNFTIPGDLVVGGIIYGVLDGIQASNYTFDYSGFGWFVSDPVSQGTYLVSLNFSGTSVSLGAIKIGTSQVYWSSIGLADNGKMYQLSYYEYSGDRFFGLYEISSSFVRTLIDTGVEIELLRVFNI